MATLDPGAIFSDLLNRYLKLPLAQKVVFPLLVIASIAGIVFVSKWASVADYAVLYSDLEPTDAAAVVQRLKEQKVKYEVQAGGTTIAISPPEMVHELRLGLASEGLPKAGKVGFEILDGTNFGMTLFQEKTLYQRASQGEIERTISSLDAVSSVRVHISQPEKSVFAKKDVKPTASVMIKLRPGGSLDKKQIKGIAHLVAGSIEGLLPDNVSIIDVYGNLLTWKEDEEGLGVEATRMQYQREFEQAYVQRVEQMLAKILGPGRVVARVTADLDYSQSEREEESFDPGGKVVRSERSVQEGAGSGQRGGVPGVVSNLTNDPNLLAPQGTGQESSSRKEDIKNYEVSRAVVKSSSPRGRLVRLSTAVLVDGTYEVDPNAPVVAGADKPKVYKPLAAEVLGQIESLVKSAIGFDGSRGDSLTVENLAFNVPDESLEKVLQNSEFAHNMQGYLVKLFPWFIGLMFFMFLVRPLVKHILTPPEAEVDLARLLPSGLAELEQELESERTKAKIPSFEPAVDLEQLEELMAENSRIVKENPQQAALLIRYWLNDGRL